MRRLPCGPRRAMPPSLCPPPRCQFPPRRLRRVPGPSPFPAWVVLAWLVGAAVCTARFLVAHARVRRLTRLCLPLLPALRAAVDSAVGFPSARTGPAGTPPLVWGWPRPTLLLPPEAAGWPAARLRAVLQHEAAHVRRRDWLTQALTQAACALYWFNPLVWLLAARLGAEAERACDDAVLLSGIPAADYAGDLLAVARGLGAGRPVLSGTVAMARRAPVRSRLEAILDPRRPRRRLTRRAAALALSAALLTAAPLAALRPAVRADTPAADTPSVGVPTATGLQAVQRHLHTLEQSQAAYAAAHPNTLTPAQAALVDKLIFLSGLKRGYDRFDARVEAQYRQARKDVKKPHSLPERQDLWRTIFSYEHVPPSVVQQTHDFNADFARRRREVDALPAEQVARETRIYDFDNQIALARTRLEAMQMEQAEGYSLHLSEEDIADMADLGFREEREGQGPRAVAVRAFLLRRKIERHKPLSDADIDAAVAILHVPSETPSQARLNILGLFRRLPDPSPVQQQKILAAVTPFLTSRDKWERKFANGVVKRFGGGAPVPL